MVGNAVESSRIFGAQLLCVPVHCVLLAAISNWNSRGHIALEAGSLQQQQE